MKLTEFYTRYGIPKRTFYERMKRVGIDTTTIRDSSGQLTPEGIERLLSVVTEAEQARAGMGSPCNNAGTPTDSTCGNGAGVQEAAQPHAEAPITASDSGQVYLLGAEVERLQGQIQALQADIGQLRAERDEFYQLYRTEREHARDLEQRMASYMDRQQTNVERLEALLASALARPAIPEQATESSSEPLYAASEAKQSPAPIAADAGQSRRKWSIWSIFRK